MVGFAADGASVMFGEHNSVAVRFKREIPNLFVFKCICHSLALAVSYACKVLPPELLTLFDDIHRFLKCSPKRQETLRRFQTLLDLPEHKILRFFKLRWLSLVAFVSRFTEQYDALFIFFQEEARSKDKKVAAEAARIHGILRNPYIPIYLHFLNFVLPLVTKRNAEFQSERPKVHELHRKMTTLFKTITGFYLKEDYVERTDPEFIAYTEEMQTPANQEYWEPLRDVELGPTALSELQILSTKTTAQKIDDFRQICRKFYITLASQIMLRFPFNDPQIKIMEKFSFIDPYFLKSTRNITDIVTVLQTDVEAVHAEFKAVRMIVKVSNNYEDDVSGFWRKILKFEDNEINEYPILSTIVERIMIFPHSSATVERIFSSINLNKTKTRNRLSVEMLAGLLHSKKLGTNLYDVNYEPMIKLMNSENMY